jgi:lysophospholipase L1-like esterase
VLAIPSLRVSTRPVATTPGQLQIMLDQSYAGKYSVTNLGACGSTMMKGADSPYWKRPQYNTLTAAKWDIIIIMLGTNDAKEYNWKLNDPNGRCAGAGALTCPFAVDYMAMINLVKTLGTTSAGPKIFVAVPPPLMQNGGYGMNQTVINTGFPMLVKSINTQNKMDTAPIDVFAALGGVADWAKTFPPKGCRYDTFDDDWGPFDMCPYFCDKQSCDQCHPDDNGYTALAAAMKKGIGL